MKRNIHYALIVGGLVLFSNLSFSVLIFKTAILTPVMTEIIYTTIIVIYFGVCLLTYSYSKRYKNSLESKFIISILIAFTLLNIIAFFDLFQGFKQF